MSRTPILLLATLFTLFSAAASAKTEIHQYKVADVLSNPEYSSQLEGVQFFFGNQPHPAVVESFGEFRTNKKTNAFGKDDYTACEWVFMSAMLQLHKRAISVGANAVVNIRSNFKNRVVSSDTEFTCGAGFATAGVALIGDFVRIGE